MLFLYMSSSTFSQAERKKIFLTTKWIKHRGRDASILYALLCWKSCKNRRKWPTCTEGTYARRQSITELQGIEKGPNKQGGKKKNFLTSSAESSGSSAMVWPVAGFNTSNIVAERCTLKNRSCDWKDLLAATAIVFLASTINIWKKIADQSCNWRFPKFLGLIFYATLTRQGLLLKSLKNN